MARTKKTDNASLPAKLALRRLLLQRHHADGDIRVFDCCQGEGVIWSKMREEFRLSSYWGVDIKPKRGRLKVDSVRVVCQPGLKANVIDIDTYGLPWAHWVGLLPNIVEPTTVFLTVGLATTAGGAPLPKVVRHSLGIGGDWVVPNAFTEQLLKLTTHHYLAMESETGYRVVEAFSASNSKTTYIGVRLDRPAAALPEPPRKRLPQKR